MSSFDHPHALFLFDLRNGRKRLAYGRDPADALAVLRLRLPDEEMGEIVTESAVKIQQRDLPKFVDQLG